MLKEYGLPNSFTVDDPMNLLPTHAKCNSQKGATVFQPSARHFFLEIARTKAQRVLAEERVSPRIHKLTVY
jgi:hypothetical protein